MSKCVILCLFCVHSVSFCVKLCQTFPDFVQMYLVVLGKPNGDILTDFANLRHPGNNLELKNFSNIHLWINLPRFWYLFFQILDCWVLNFARHGLYVSKMIECCWPGKPNEIKNLNRISNSNLDADICKFLVFTPKYQFNYSLMTPKYHSNI